MTLKEFDVASFVKSLATEGKSSIVTPGGAVVSIARKVEGQHRIDTPYVATCNRCAKSIVFSVRDLAGLGLQTFLAYCERHRHTAEMAS